MNKQFNRYISDDDIYLFNTGNACKAWLFYGCTYIPELSAHRFAVWAPNAETVSVVGSFNSWDSGACPMEKHNGGVWTAFVSGLSDGTLYKYAIKGADGVERVKADPFGNFNENRSSTASIVCCGSSFCWEDSAWMNSRANTCFESSAISIYEVHAGSWKKLPGFRPVYRELADSLSEYCRDMAYTHVELLPLTEYPYDASWGYQVGGYYAPTSRYGSPDDFRYFVNTMHKAGIGVIIDWVPAHFPKDAHGLAQFDGTPLFECKEKRMAEHPEWGTLIFDYASPQVQSFLVSSACKFFEEYHIDGIRVDAVTSMLYLSYARKPGEYTPNRYGGDINLDAVDFLRKLNSTVKANYPGAITIAEESSAYPGVTAAPEDDGLGFSLKWDMGYMHDTLDYMAVDPLFRGGVHNKLTFSMMYAFSEKYVLAYSHDEVVHCKGSMINKMYGDYDAKFASLRTLYGYQFAHPGKKLNFMGNEFGQFIEWNFEQELDWLLLNYPRHSEMKTWYRELNRFYRSHPALYEIDNSWDGFTWLNVDDRDRSTIAFLRRSGNMGVVCVCNFTPVKYDGFVIGLPERGTLKEALSSDETRFGGSGCASKKAVFSRHEGFCGLPNSAAITVPPSSCVYYEYHIRGKQEGQQ